MKKTTMILLLQYIDTAIQEKAHHLDVDIREKRRLRNLLINDCEPDHIPPVEDVPRKSLFAGMFGRGK